VKQVLRKDIRIGLPGKRALCEPGRLAILIPLMVTLELTTLIHAAIERCFDLSRSVDLHVRSTADTGERAIAGVTSGLIGPGEQVTWRAKHFGIWQDLTSKITAFEQPNYFQDTMVRGAFRSFKHDHYFSEFGDGKTAMRDVLKFAAPLPLAGLLAEQLLRPYLARFLRDRNDLIKRVAESDEWHEFL
jgi:ligand-binding SRPBCC domain-containing protein